MQRFRNFSFIVLGLVLGLGGPVLAAASADAVTGLWRDDGSILWVQRVNDTLHAQLIALRPERHTTVRVNRHPGRLARRVGMTIIPMLPSKTDC